MPSDDAIREVFRDWVLAGVRQGPATEAHVERMAEIWARVLPLSDEDFRCRANQWLQRAVEPWWPLPGAIMQMPGLGTGPVLVSEDQVRRMQKRSEEIAGELWAEVVMPLARRGSVTAEGSCEDEAEEEAVREGLRAIGGLRAVGSLEVDSRAMGEKRAVFLGAAANVLRRKWGGKVVRMVGR